MKPSPSYEMSGPLGTLNLKSLSLTVCLASVVRIPG
jgi:hypothetical protein